MAPFFLFTLGLAVGSFLNVLIYRLPRGIGIGGRSFCPQCKKQIAWYDTIPLLSFLLLGGKCRSCRSPIPKEYPLVELVTAVLFSMALFSIVDNNFQFSIFNFQLILNFQLFYYLFIVSSLIAIFFIDLRHRIIPDVIVYPSVVISFLFLISQYPNISISYIFSALGAFLFFLALFLITRGRGMGFGDVKLSFLMGLFLGFPKIVIALYLAFLTGAFVSIILIVGRKATRKSAIPFGPFLVVGTFVAFFWGEKIVQFVSRFVHL